MKNNLIALFLSILIHIVILALFLFKLQDNTYIPPKHGTQDGERISIKDFKFTQPPQNLPQPSTPQTPKSTPLESNPTPKETPQTTKRDETPKQEPTKEIKKEEKKQNKTNKEAPKPAQSTQNSLASSLRSTPQPPSSPSIYDYGRDMGNQEIRELYGEDLYSLSLEERRFIEDNLSGIGRITQMYLKYPEIAGQMGQQGDNVVEFYLHPNGDISDLKLLTPSGYRLLDENSIHTIEIAYKDYPYPAVKTKIRIRVMYRIY